MNSIQLLLQKILLSDYRPRCYVLLNNKNRTEALVVTRLDAKSEPNEKTGMEALVVADRQPARNRLSDCDRARV